MWLKYWNVVILLQKFWFNGTKKQKNEHGMEMIRWLSDIRRQSRMSCTDRQEEEVWWLQEAPGLALSLVRLSLACVSRLQTVIVCDCEDPGPACSWKDGINTLWVPQDPAEELIRFLEAFLWVMLKWGPGEAARKRQLHHVEWKTQKVSHCLWWLCCTETSSDAFTSFKFKKYDAHKTPINPSPLAANK